MNLLRLLLLIALLTPGWACKRAPEGMPPELAAKLGGRSWSTPEKRLVRATIYQKGSRASDPDSRMGRSDGKLALRYATKNEAGTLAVPDWMPRGSMVKIHTEHGVFAYIAADEGTDVESRKASRESGKTNEQEDAPVLDFCASEQLWPDFVNVDIYYYAGKVPFDKLSAKEQKKLFAYAMEYVRKRE